MEKQNRGITGKAVNQSGMVLFLASVFAVLASSTVATWAQTVRIEHSTLEFRTSPIVDLHMMLRSRDTDGKIEDVDSARLPDLGAALAAFGELQEVLGGERGWLMFEGNFDGCDSARQLLERFEGLPESARGQPLRENALNYAQALAGIEPEFLNGPWKKRKTRLNERLIELEELLDPHIENCIRFINRSLNITDPLVSIPVYITIDGPAPGASTSATVDDRGVCFVALSTAEGTQFVEAVLHEAIHALDIATRQQSHALNSLRTRLVESGIKRTDKRWRDTWHTIMFLQAGATVRKFISTEHRDYGEAHDYYSRVSRIVEIERPVWRAWLNGSLTIDAAIERIVTEISSDEFSFLVVKFLHHRDGPGWKQQFRKNRALHFPHAY